MEKGVLYEIEGLARKIEELDLLEAQEELRRQMHALRDGRAGAGRAK